MEISDRGWSWRIPRVCFVHLHILEISRDTILNFDDLSVAYANLINVSGAKGVLLDIDVRVFMKR